MKYAFKDKTEYLFQTQKEKISFAKFQLTSQLSSVQKRTASLAHDLIIYLCFTLIPIFLSALSLFISFMGNIILNIIFVPLLFASILAMFLLTPYGLYKLCMGGLIYLFNLYGNSLTLFGNTISIYTYKMEENYCLGKLKKLEAYEKQIAEWEESEKNGKPLPDYAYMEQICDKMELDINIKVATMDDPLVKRFGKIALILYFAALILYVIAIWTKVFLSFYPK